MKVIYCLTNCKATLGVVKEARRKGTLMRWLQLYRDRVTTIYASPVFSRTSLILMVTAEDRLDQKEMYLDKMHMGWTN